MRDEKDPGTAEMPLVRKRGPRPKHDKAMSAAERMRHYRLMRKVRADTLADTAQRHPRAEVVFEDCAEVTLLDALRAAMLEGDAKRVRKFCELIAKRYS